MIYENLQFQEVKFITETETEKIDIKVDIFSQDNVLESMDVKFKIIKGLM